MVADGGAADFVEAEGCVEGVGDGIGRVEIDFADDAGVAGGLGAGEKIGIEGASVAFAAGGGGDDYSVYVDEFFLGVVIRCGVLVARVFEVGAEPGQVFVIVGEGLIETDEQGFGVVDGGGEERGADDLVEFGEGEWGELDGMVVVEGEERFGGGVEGLDLLGHGRRVVDTEKRRGKTGFYHRGHRGLEEKTKRSAKGRMKSFGKRLTQRRRRGDAPTCRGRRRAQRGEDSPQRHIGASKV